MSRARYSASLKIEAVQRVVRDGRSVHEVAREMRVGEGSLFFWLRRYREFGAAERNLQSLLRAGMPASPTLESDHRVGAGSTVGIPGTLVALLRRRQA